MYIQTFNISKVVVIVLGLLFLFFFAPTTSVAHDVFWGVTHGLDQDLVVLVSVEKVIGETALAHVVFVFPVSREKVGKNITIRDKGLKTGKIYFAALNRQQGEYIPAMMPLKEITDSDYKKAKLVNADTSEDLALERFINTGGVEKEFSFMQDGVYSKTADGRQELLNPKDDRIFYIAGLMIFSVVAGFFVLNTFYKKHFGLHNKL